MTTLADIIQAGLSALGGKAPEKPEGDGKPAEKTPPEGTEKTYTLDDIRAVVKEELAAGAKPPQTDPPKTDPPGGKTDTTGADKTATDLGISRELAVQLLDALGTGGPGGTPTGDGSGDSKPAERSFDRELSDADVDAFIALPIAEQVRRQEEFNRGMLKTKMPTLN